MKKVKKKKKWKSGEEIKWKSEEKKLKNWKTEKEVKKRRKKMKKNDKSKEKKWKSEREKTERKKIVPVCPNWSQRVKNGPKKFNMVLNGLQWSQMVLNCQQQLKITTINLIWWPL